MSHELFSLFDEISQKRSNFLEDPSNRFRKIDFENRSTPLEFSGLEVNVSEEYFYTRSLGMALAIAESIGKLYQMKSEADAADAEAQALQEIAQKIAALEVRLSKIESQLDDIRIELRGLSVKIDELPALSAVNVLRGRVDVIVDFIAAWTKNPKDPEIRPQITQNFVDVAQSVRTQMRHGYAHCLDVFIGFSFELELAFLLGYKAKDIRASVDRIIRYASDLFDAGRSGSIGAVLVSIEAEMKRLEAEDLAINRERIFLGGHHRDICCRDGSWEATNFYCQVTGDIKTGYRVNKWSTFDAGWCTCNDGLSRFTELEEELVNCSCGTAEPSTENSARRIRACPHDEIALTRKATRYEFLTQTKANLQALKRQIGEIKSNIEARSTWQGEFDK